MPVKHNILKVHYRNEEVEAWYNNFEIDPNEGLDLVACNTLKLQPGANGFIDLGIVVKPPYGFRVEIVMRSSTYKRYGIILANHYGVIDPRYCGEKDYLRAHVVSISNPTVIPAGARICQIVLRRIAKIDGVEKFDPSEVSRGGFGSTGV